MEFIYCIFWSPVTAVDVVCAIRTLESLTNILQLLFYEAHQTNTNYGGATGSYHISTTRVESLQVNRSKAAVHNMKIRQADRTSVVHIWEKHNHRHFRGLANNMWAAGRYISVN